MTDKVQKIREEVEKKLEVMQYLVHRKDAYKELKGILNYIDSLQEEPVSDDLEEASNEYADKHGFRVPYDGSNNFYDEVDVKASKEGFIAGANWEEEKDIKHIMAYTIDYCEQHGTNIATQEVYDEWAKDVYEATH